MCNKVHECDIMIRLYAPKCLQYGYYLFHKESLEDYPLRLQEIASLIIDTDLPAVEDVEYSTVQKAKKILMILAKRVPFTPNISQ